MQSDETLGWKLSFIDGPQEASQLFTPKGSATLDKNAQVSGKTDDLLRSALHPQQQQQQERKEIKERDDGPVRSFEDDNIFMNHDFNAGLIP